MTPNRHELTVNADYHQFYVLGSAVPLDASGTDDFWTRETLARLLAAGPGILDLAAGDHVVEAELALDSVVDEEGDDHYAVFLRPGTRSGEVMKRWPGAAKRAGP